MAKTPSEHTLRKTYSDLPRGGYADENHVAAKRPREQHEQTIPLMLRPKLSQKECAELVAQQIGSKRSQLDPTFYLQGALLSGVEQLGKAEMIGSWTRKEVAVFLKSAFTPLFELLYEQDELPLVFTLLFSRGLALPTEQPSLPAITPQQPSSQIASNDPLSQQEQPLTEDTYIQLLSEDVEVGLDGFPGGI
jgi:hypothetical protein